MKPILDYDKDFEGGFYYDRQRKNEFTRVSLHANAVPTRSAYTDWLSWANDSGKGKHIYRTQNGETSEIDTEIDPNFAGLTDTDGNKFLFGPDNVFDNESNKSVDGKDVRYGKQSLCNSILTEDFGISIANNWGDFSAGQSLESMFNQTKAYEPYLNKATALFAKITEGIGDYEKGLEKNGVSAENSAAGFVGKVVKTLGRVSKVGGNILRRSLVVQGTRFKYYSGTGIAFSNLGMKFTLFPDYFGNRFKTVEEQLAPLHYYSIGKFVNFLDQSDPELNNAADDILDTLGASSENKNNIKKDINTYLGWQIPPGGFKASLSYIDYVQFGTVMLKLGAYYCLKNLVIQEIQLNYSKHVAKYYDIVTKEIRTCPLYCDVFITFTPANKYSDKKLKEFVVSRETKEISDIENKIRDRLNFK